MPPSSTNPTTLSSEPVRPTPTSRPPGLTPMERHLLDQVSRIASEAQAREAQHRAEMAALEMRMQAEVTSLRMELKACSGLVMSLSITLGALLGPEEPSGS